MTHTSRWITTALAVAFLLLSALPVAAAIQARVVVLNFTPPNMVRASVAVNRGVFMGATHGNAPFALVILVTYQSGGALVSDQAVVALADLAPVGMLDNRSVIVQATFTLSSSPDAGSVFNFAARITTHDPVTGETIDVTEPELTSF